MRFQQFSQKQLQALTWWSDASPRRDWDAIICDGAVRSGKTLCMGISFLCWAMRRFDGMRFALCGKTIGSLRRNVTNVLLPVMGDLGFVCREKVSQNLFTLEFGGRRNTFYLFGGQHEGSPALIQGITLAGVLFDEVALMPRSFVEQALARCSVSGSKFWFNCNPEGPQHWFYLEWIRKAASRRALYLHFSLEDNPSLSRRVIARYREMYSGVFYRRFVLGEWVAPRGLIYDFFDESQAPPPPPEEELLEFAVSCDYGTSNPTSFGLWGRRGGVWYRIREYYYDSRREGRQKTDAEYVQALRELVGGRPLRCVVVDPSAASFIEALRQAGFPVVKAKNDVLSGIRRTADLLRSGKIVITDHCPDALREFGQYCWDEDALPVVDAAISKIIRLTGGVHVECEDPRAERELEDFLRRVNTGCGQRGIGSFLDRYMDSMLACGCAVGEIILQDNRDIAAVLCGDITRICVREGQSPLDFAVCALPEPGKAARPLPCQELLLFTPFAPSEDRPWGNSMISGMSYMASLLLKIYRCIGQNWQRAGNVRYAVVCRPTGDGMDNASARERSEEIAREWAKVMGSGGPVSDFVAVGDVDIRAIGADEQILDSETPVRQVLEQIVAKTGVPPFLLGLSWSTTERMSAQQTDILTTEISAIRRSLSSVVERICDLWLRLHGYAAPYRVVWDEINLQDTLAEARAALLQAQAANLTKEEDKP